jgi:hypothetical protein
MTVLGLALLSASVLTTRPPGSHHQRVPLTVDIAITTVTVTLEYVLLMLPFAAHCLHVLTHSGALALPPVARALSKLAVRLRVQRPLLRLDHALASERHTNMNALSALGLLIILLLPLLAGTPVPVSVLMERAWWPWFNAGDVLLTTAKVPVSPGHWVMYRDAGTTAALRIGNASTALGLLVDLRCGALGNGTCAGGVAGPSTATAFYPLSLRVLGPHKQGNASVAEHGAAMPTHALILRRRRSSRPGVSLGAPAGPCPASALLKLPARPGHDTSAPMSEDDSWECAPVPTAAVLGAVAVRAPRAAAPAIPLCAARRWALDMRPPSPRLAPSIAAAWKRSSVYTWAVKTAEAAEKLHSDRVACERLTAEARAAQISAEAATGWGKRAAVAAARDAADKAANASGPCGRVRTR